MTSQQIEKIKELNGKIRQEELRLREQYLALRRQLKELISQNLVDDFNICFMISVFSDDDTFNQKYKVETGDAFYESTLLTSGYLEDDDIFFENWNESQCLGTNTLAELCFCWTMHDIIFHSNLKLEDVLAIDDVWLEMKVDYQFWTNKGIIK